MYDCTIRDNYAEDEGGGLYHSTAVRCLIESNDCDEGAGMFGGSATASTLAHNDSGAFGGGANTTTLRDCLLYGNYAANYGGGAANSRSTIARL